MQARVVWIGSVLIALLLFFSSGATTAEAATLEWTIGQALTLIGDGTVVLNNATNPVPAVVIGSGAGPGPTLRQGVSNALNNIVLTVNAGGTLDIGGFTTLFNTISGAGRIETGGSGATADLRGNNATFSGTYHGPGSASVNFTTNAVTLAGTHTLANQFQTSAPELVVDATIPQSSPRRARR
jgi:hypothetical protein